jgi:hypothetical protein
LLTFVSSNRYISIMEPGRVFAHLAYGRFDSAKIRMISVVDDDRFVREAMRDLLQSLGLEAATFESAEQFLDSGRLAETS